MMDRIKVLILYNKIFHYRIPIWNILADRCDLTVTYSLGDIPRDIDIRFNTLFLPFHKWGPFVIHRDNIRKLASQYDAVIAYGNITWLKFSSLPWFNKTKVIFHTIGVSASYNKEFDKHRGWDRIRAFFYKKADALAFYTQYPIDKYEKLGIRREKMFEAPNTVAVSPIESCKKDSILMIGTLYRAKGLQLLLDAYLELKNKCTLPVLNIIGQGPDYENVKSWIQENDMQDKIVLRGAIYDINEKAKFFSKALACISPRQAGLTVLESMGYGVPFITIRNAITGGELFNVHNGEDGVILDDESQLSSTISDIAENPQKYVIMGEKAQQYYKENRTPTHMADGLWNSIVYAINNT